MDKSNLINVARGLKDPDLVLKNCKIINVFNGMIEVNDIAIYKGVIAGIGKYQGSFEIDCTNKYISPGFIDGHVHIESSMLSPRQFAKIILPKGTTSIIADPHEIGNVCGINGLDYMIKASENTNLDIFLMLPSCVPSTEFENAGANLKYNDLLKYKDHPSVLGLGEMMNYVGVLNSADEVLKKLSLFKSKINDGHAPDILGKDLNAYIASGINTDHECTTAKELVEKVSKGMYVHIREGSATRNLETLIKGVNKHNLNRILFCTDDKHLFDIKSEGHINYNIKLAIKNGVDPVDAIKMATINIASCYGLKRKGAIAPGYDADIVVLDDLLNVSVSEVYKNGVLVARNDKFVGDNKPVFNESVLNTVKIKDSNNLDLKIKLNSNLVNVIKLVDKNILTEKVIRKVNVEEGLYKYNDEIDILKIAVIERHNFTGNIGIGLVEGYGFKGGAVALSIAHDSHNIIVIGDNDDDMKLAVKELERVNGGITVCENGKVLETLELEISGLMTDKEINYVEEKIHNLEKIIRGKGVSKLIDPFLTLSFLALPVVPEIKITDLGLFDVKKLRFINIEV